MNIYCIDGEERWCNPKHGHAINAPHSLCHFVWSSVEMKDAGIITKAIEMAKRLRTKTVIMCIYLKTKMDRRKVQLFMYLLLSIYLFIHPGSGLKYAKKIGQFFGDEYCQGDLTTRLTEQKNELGWVCWRQ